MLLLCVSEVVRRRFLIVFSLGENKVRVVLLCYVMRV